MTDLRPPPAYEHGGDPFAQRVREYSGTRPLQRIHVLEAGCGWGPALDLSAIGGVERHVTGVDLDLPALRAHTLARSDLDCWHLGDLRTVPLPPREYDVVHVPFLIERIPHAELVLDRFVAALKPGGLLLVRLRDRIAAEHPTPLYEQVASRQGMRWYCVMRGLVVAEVYVSRDTLAAFGRWTRVIGWLGKMVATLSGNRLTADHSEVTMVIRKPENRFARVI